MSYSEVADVINGHQQQVINFWTEMNDSGMKYPISSSVSVGASMLASSLFDSIESTIFSSSIPVLPVAEFGLQLYYSHVKGQHDADMPLRELVKAVSCVGAAILCSAPAVSTAAAAGIGVVGYAGYSATRWLCLKAFDTMNMRSRTHA